MSKKAKSCVCTSTDEDSGFSSSEESYDDDVSSEDDETVEVNGFHVLLSQESQVKKLFKEQPDLTSKFNLKNQKLKDAHMDVLLDLTETLSKSTKEVSFKELNKADKTLLDLTSSGFKVGWLRQKFDEAYVKKEKQRVNGARIRELEEQVKKRKLTLSNLESDLKKEKDAALAAKARTCLYEEPR